MAVEVGLNIRRDGYDPSVACPITGNWDISQIWPPELVISGSLPYEDRNFRLPITDPGSPPGNSCLLFYQADGYNRIAIVPGRTNPLADVRIEDHP
jgi:hypothetical protein